MNHTWVQKYRNVWVGSGFRQKRLTFKRFISGKV